MKQCQILFLVMVLGYLGSYGGKLCIYNKENGSPVQIFPYSITIFTETDQGLLAKGIPYTNIEELDELIADYMS